MTPNLDAFVPCPTCKQYSHSISDDKLAEAFNHFQTLIGHPVRGTPMGDAFDAKTRDAAQVLMAAAMSPTPASVTEEAVTVGAAAIVDIWMGGNTEWRARLDDSTFLESADWQRALEEARAAILAMSRMTEGGARQALSQGSTISRGSYDE